MNDRYPVVARDHPVARSSVPSLTRSLVFQCKAIRCGAGRTLAALLVAAVVLAGTIHAAQAAPAPEADGLPSAFFDPNSVGWLSVRNMTSAQYGAFFDEKSRDGFMVIDVEVDVIDGVERVGAVWQKNTDGRGWAQLRNLTSDEFHTKWTEYKDAGYRLIDQETYVDGANRYYAGVWVQNKENLDWASYRDATDAQFAANFDTYKNAGFLMIDVEAYPFGSVGTRYAAAWVKNTENLAWAEHRNLTSAQFAAKFDEYKADYRMIDVESYTVGSQQLYAGIWLENKNGRVWSELRDMTSKQFGDQWIIHRDAGYRLLDYEVYPTAAGWRYAGIWRQATERPNWPLKDEVTALAQAQMDDFDVPGMSVAIAVGGQWVYLRGFGFADVDDAKIAHSRTVYQLASVSKAVAGVLGVRLDQLGQLDLDATTATYVAGLPAHHLAHTVRQTISNRSGIGHHSTYTGQYTNLPYDTTQDTVDDIEDVALATTTGDYLYSSPAFTFEGAAIEAATGLAVGNALDTYLATPFTLNTLRSMHGKPPDANRATGYSTSNQELGTYEASHKVLGGGLESSPYDLARMGIKLIDGQILLQASLDDMWDAPDSQSTFALGWTENVEFSTQVVARTGGQDGANTHIRMYPDKDVVIVVLSNRWKGGHSATKLGQEIGALIIAELDGAAQAAADGQKSATAAGDFEEPDDEATDPALVSFPVITNPVAPDPFSGEEYPEEYEVTMQAFLPLVGK